ncbi:MAG: hypothetical protein QUS35_05745 [bacterium]|nr:hypothetical protein [bacterium]
MAQQELFDAPSEDKTRRRVKELDAEIETALKRGDFVRARTLTDQQSELLRRLLDSDETERP